MNANTYKREFLSTISRVITLDIIVDNFVKKTKTDVQENKSS